MQPALPCFSLALSPPQEAGGQERRTQGFGPPVTVCRGDVSSFCPQDIVAGDMSKKSLWEQKGGSKTSSTVKVESICSGGGERGSESNKGPFLVHLGGLPGGSGISLLPCSPFALGLRPRQSTPSGKRYKFVATGHGKYEKVLMDEGSAP